MYNRHKLQLRARDIAPMPPASSTYVVTPEGLWVDQYGWVDPDQGYRGPSLHRRLGLETCCVWEYLQKEAADTLRRGRLQQVEYGPVVELSRAIAAKKTGLSVHAVSRALAKLETACIISRRRSQRSTFVTVLYFDTVFHYVDDTKRRHQQHGADHFDIPPCVLGWLKSTNGRGKKKSPRPLAGTNAVMVVDVDRVEPGLALRLPYERPDDSPNFATCLVPRDPPRFPLLPKPECFPKGMDFRDKCDMVERAYITTAQAFWAGATVGHFTRWFRSAKGMRQVKGAVLTLQENKLPVHEWLVYFFNNARRKSKVPTHPEFALEPTLIEAKALACKESMENFPWRGELMEGVTPALDKYIPLKREYRRLHTFVQRLRAYGESVNKDPQVYGPAIDARYPNWRPQLIKAEQTSAVIYTGFCQEAFVHGTFLWLHIFDYAAG